MTDIDYSAGAEKSSINRRAQYYINIAKAVAQGATCPRAKCGCVIVHPKTKGILSTGYNGAPPGEDHCIDVGCLMEDDHCQRAIHAECNAITFAARHSVSIDGAHAYIYGNRKDGEIKEVCRECAKILKSANVTVIQCQGDDS